MSNCVLQDWVQELTWKEQSALFTAIRGSDAVYNQHVRSLVRWYRRAILHDADVDGVFVKFGNLPNEKELKSAVEYMTLHFVSHLMHGLEIIGYKAKDENTRTIAIDYYKMMCEILHCNMESEEQMDQRLKDNKETIKPKVEQKQN